MIHHLRQFTAAFDRSIAAIAFLPKKHYGLFLLAIITCIAPVSAALALLSFIAAYSLDTAFNRHQHEYMDANPILFGLLLAYGLGFNQESICLAIIGGLFIAIVQLAFERAAQSKGIVLFTLSFVLATFLLLHHITWQVPNINTFGSMWLSQLGCFFLMPDPLFGACVAALLLWHSRILFGLSLLGS